MRILSKSKLLAYRQCPKRLWLEINKPELRQDSASTEASFAIGHQVGDIARSIYDPNGKGNLIDIQKEGYDAAFSRSKALLDSDQPIFEAGFSAAGALSFADVMVPDYVMGAKVWRMIEVKSSTSVKDYHKDDSAIQAFIAKSAGVPLASIALAHIDSSWVYPGEMNYDGLLVESDLTTEAFSREEEVKEWISHSQTILTHRTEPEIKTGNQCSSPYACGFFDYCCSQEPQAEYPVHWLPNIRTNALKSFVSENPYSELSDTPNELLNELQLRVKSCTLSGEPYFNKEGAKKALAGHKLPAYFLDFETIQFAVPIWEGTRPYQMIPFQFSLHILDAKGKLHDHEFLDLSGNDPSESFAKSLIALCGDSGPVFVYNAGFEGARINELANRFEDLSDRLLAIKNRIVDLHPITKDHYYHPSQHGSWSIKSVLPAVAPELSYALLEGVQDGGMAMNAFMEAISPSSTSDRKDEIRQQLLAYCKLDTFAMVKLWQFLSGNEDFRF